MSNSRQELQTELKEQEEKLAETMRGALGRGMHQDVLRMLIPIFQEQNQLMQKLLAEISNVNSDMLSKTDPRLYSGQ